MRRKLKLSRASWPLLGNALLLIVALVMMPLVAQETTGGFTGTVMDTSGAVIPGASVEIAGENLVRPVKTETGADGIYVVHNLPPGMYSVTVTAEGFVKTTLDRIPLSVGQLPRVDVTVEVGQVTETVTVAANAMVLDTTQSAVSYNIDRRIFENLPRSRSFDSMIAVAPGARMEDDGGGWQLDGASGSENTFIINGIEMTNMMDGTLKTTAKIPFEFVEEVQVKNSGFQAEYGGAMGGVVNTVIRSGSNDFHGEVGFYLESDSMNAMDRPELKFDPLDDDKAYYQHQEVKDGFRNYMPGASIGGPIAKNKAWFFASYYPQLRKTERTVTFVSDGSTRDFERTTKNDYLVGKIDVAPLDKLRAYGGWLYSARKRNGLLPDHDGTDNPDAVWADRGWRYPAQSTFFGADYTVTPKFLLTARGGYNYYNYKDYGIPRGIYYRNMTSSVDLVGLDGTPVRPEFQHASGVLTASNRQTLFDKQDRWNFSLDGSYMFSAGGNHTLKAGYQMNRLHNSVAGSFWPDGYIRFYWDSAFRMPGSSVGQRGNFGYYRVLDFRTGGDVASYNHSIYFQDNWRVNQRLTLNLGLRMENEYLPSFRVSGNIPSKAINFGFGDKLAPRLGAAYDVTGNGKIKIFGSFGLFYDLMKYEMPRGSFGGDQWVDSYYYLDTDDYTQISFENRPGKHIGDIDRRIPSNDPSDNRIDPNLMPTRKRSFDVGSEFAVTDDMVLKVRYNYNKLDRTIEDVGVLTPAGEVYYIANPGFGLVADPSFWDEGIPTTPKAKRNYHAVETQLTKRFGNLQFITSYTWSRLTGNYSGLASSDEEGRNSPNVNRFFDLPQLGWDPRVGGYADGVLSTDRPHTFKFNGYYTLNWKGGATSFSPLIWLYSGTPITTGVEVNGGDVDTYPEGRGDYGRTPFFEQVDFAISHDINMTERLRLRIEFNAINLFNNSNGTRMHRIYNHAHDGYIGFDNEADIFHTSWDYKQLMKEQNIRVDPRYGWADAFQRPRELRLGFKFLF